MHRLFAASMLAITLAAASPAAAAPLPAGGLTLEDVSAWLTRKGETVEMREFQGKRFLAVRAGSVEYQVWMYECTGPRCTSIQYAVSWSGAGRMDQIDARNKTKRWLRLYEQSGNIFGEYDAVIQGGTWEQLDAGLAMFFSAVSDASATLGATQGTGGSAVGSSSSQSATPSVINNTIAVSVCNNTGENQNVAAYFTEAETNRNVSRGWWVFVPGECAVIFRTTQPDVYLYSYGQRYEYRGENGQCTRAAEFRIYDDQLANRNQCATDMTVKQFRKIQIAPGQREFTWNLNPG